MLHLHCESPYFELIKSGRKRVEGRLAKEKYLSLKPGSRICFNSSLEVSVKAVRRYTSFKEMIEKETVDAVLPEYSGNRPEQVYRSFYSETDEKKYGVVAIEVAIC